MLELKEQGFYPNRFNVRGEDFDVQRYFREWKKHYIKEGILYRRAIIDDQKVNQLVLPEVYRKVAFQGIHRDTGHPGKEKNTVVSTAEIFLDRVGKGDSPKS